MRLKDKESWDSWVENNKDPYGKCCIEVARRVMEYLDDDDEQIDANEMITRANRDIDEDSITGFMAGAVAHMVSTCHERGKDFQKSWNKSCGGDEDIEGTINPAIITIKE